MPGLIMAGSNEKWNALYTSCKNDLSAMDVVFGFACGMPEELPPQKMSGLNVRLFANVYMFVRIDASMQRIFFIDVV